MDLSLSLISITYRRRPNKANAAFVTHISSSSVICIGTTKVGDKGGGGKSPVFSEYRF